MEEEKKEKGLLRKAFEYAAKGVVMGTIAAVFWQVILDPIFFPLIHDVFNINTQAWVAFVQSHLNWIPEMLGFSGDGGLLNTDFMQAILEPYKEQVAVPAEGMINNFADQAFEMSGEAFSPDLLNSLIPE